MHPVFGSPRRLWTYLGAWLPLSIFVAALIALSDDQPWMLTLLVTVPLMLFYAFPALASWYVARALPVRKSPASAIAVQTVAAFTSAVVWLFLGVAWSRGLAVIPWLKNAPELFASHIPLFLIVGMLLFWLGASVSYLLIESESAHEREKSEMELRMLARESELRALTAQVHPHFLFNSLNAISALTTTEPAAARRMSLQLADFFRRSLKLRDQATVPLVEELSLIDSFLSIEQTRFGSRLQVLKNVAKETLMCPVPPLLLQPLVENAVNHGIATMVDGGAVRIDARFRDSMLHLSVENAFDVDVPRKSGAGIGLENVRNRIAMTYGSQGRMNVITEKGRHRVEIDLPAQRDNGAPPAA